MVSIVKVASHPIKFAQRLRLECQADAARSNDVRLDSYEDAHRVHERRLSPSSLGRTTSISPRTKCDLNSLNQMGILCGKMARMLEMLRSTASVGVCLLMMGSSLTACSEHAIDTFPEWCEQITGVDLEEKYLPFWAVLFSVSFDGEAIRDDYVKFLNNSHMEKVQNRAPRMAWREGTELHLVNLSSLLMIEPEKIIGEWRKGIETAKRYEHDNDADACLYGTLISMFDSFHIHSMESDALGRKWTDEVTVIPTERKELLGDKAL